MRSMVEGAPRPRDNSLGYRLNIAQHLDCRHAQDTNTLPVPGRN